MGAAILERFARQVARSPARVAVEQGDQVVDYAELDRRADRIAAHLQLRGVGPEVGVALLLERSPDAIAAMLGVLRAGGFYVPLDLRHPVAWLGRVLGEGGIRFALADGDVGALGAEVEIVKVAAAREGGGEARRFRPPPPGSAACCVHTSGSTGSPKGVVVSHGSLASFAAWYAREVELAADDRVLQLWSLAADPSGQEIFPCLCSGATLVLRAGAMLESTEALLASVERQRISILSIPTALWHQLSADLSATARLPPSVRVVVIGGEPALESAWRRWQAHAPAGVRLFNAYGPTEATIAATFSELTAAPADGPPPIGAPLPGVRAHVVDERGRAVVPGQPGELWIGGIGLARGYLGRPGATAERFVPDPFGDRPGARLYRTGDLVRAGRDGQLHFGGRRDDQVKVAGFRVEPGRIEAVLASHPDVAECAVVAHAAGQAGPRLVGFAVCRGGVRPELRGFVAERLPPHEVPAAILSLDRLPVTPAGKIDRRALVARIPAEEASAVAEPPRPGLEERVAAIWREVLGCGPIGRRDHFVVDLGGASLAAIQVVSRLRRELGVAWSAGDLFRAPTVAGQAELLAAARGRAASAPVVGPRPERIPLSFSQERVWFLEQLEPESVAYNTSFALRLTGRIDPALLEASLGALIERHEVLRTSFHHEGGIPYQVVHPPMAAPLARADLSALPAEARERALAGRVAAGWSRPFALDRPPLVRLDLVRLGAAEHVLVVTEHHLVHDGWSISVLLRELEQIYAALHDGRPATLPPLRFQFADAALWQRREVGARMEAGLAFWRRRLAGAPEQIDLPTDRPRPAVRSSRGGEVHVRLPRPVQDAVLAFARREGLTPYMTMLAAFAALLRRHSGQEDLVVGSAVAGREGAEMEGVVGMFVNSLPLRIDAAGDPSLRQLAARVRETTLEAYAHQQIPFDRIVDAVRPRRDPGRTPLFQVDFSFHDAPVAALSLPGARGVVEYPARRSAKFDLAVTVASPSDPSPLVVWEYSADLFDAETVAGMAAHYEALLRGALLDPDRPLGDVPLAAARPRPSPPESPRSGAARPGDLLVTRIEAAVARAPDAVAVEAAGRSLRYAELDRRANRLAHRLRARGIGPEARVGLLVGRDLELAVAVLGVLKSGAALVPLDPGDPPLRLRHVVGDADLRAVVVGRGLTGRLAGDVPEVPTDGEGDAAPEDRPPIASLPDGAAAIFYTSGSSGRPKGVVLTHAGLLNHHLWHQRRFDLGPADRVLQFHSIAFDAALEEILPTWMAGATLVLRPERLFDSARALLEWAGRERVTVLDLPAAYWSQVARELEADPVPLPGCVRLVLVAGERVRGDVLASWRRSGGDAVTWFNLYGPTETSLISTAFELPAGVAPPPGDPPIGVAIDETELHVVDQRLRRVPRGAVGELCIGGRGVARGYLGQPGLTAGRLVPDPFGDRPGARIYRTGDRVRERPDGALDFVGRVDDQRKVRGVRVEPGEVEAALRGHPSVRHAAVVWADQDGGASELVAYVVPGAPGLSVDQLRQHLVQRLTAAMIPARWVVLDRLPLNRSGKLDRAALPAARPPEAPEAPASARPMTATEAGLAAIWSELLGVPSPGPEANFFELGGHSMLAMKVAFLARKRMGLEVGLQAILSAETLGALASSLDRRAAGEAHE